MKIKNKKIGLVLGGGAAKGLAHVGVLNVIDELGIKPYCIAGTSMGAIIGALHASGMSPKEIENVISKIDQKEVMRLFKLSLNGAGFTEGNNITSLLQTLLGDINIQELSMPFACVATNIINGNEIVFKKGDLNEALRASISVPGLFTPQKIDDEVLVDGGLVNPVPVDVARELGADFIIAVNVLKAPDLKHTELNFPEKEEHGTIKKKTGDIESFNTNLKNFISKEIEGIETVAKRFASLFDLSDEINVIDIISQTMLLAETNLAKHKLMLNKPDILIEPDTSEIRHLHFHKIKESILIGEKEAWKVFAKHKMI